MCRCMDGCREGKEHGLVEDGRGGASRVFEPTQLFRPRDYGDPGYLDS